MVARFRRPASARPVPPAVAAAGNSSSAGSSGDHTDPGEHSPGRPPSPPPDLPGVDISFGLKRVLDQRPIYFAMLGRLVERCRSSRNEFPQLLANSQYDEAARSAHGLRGVAATLGAKAIAAAAEQFEHGLRADPANADGAELTAAMDALIKGWDALADEQKTPTSS